VSQGLCIDAPFLCNNLRHSSRRCFLPNPSSNLLQLPVSRRKFRTEHLFSIPVLNSAEEGQAERASDSVSERFRHIKLLVVGTGAVGSLYGGKLSQVGVQVSTLCRSDFKVVRDKGIFIKSIWGDFTFHPSQVLKRASDIAEKPDYILVALKALPEIDVAELIGPAVGDNTAIVLMQNGIDIEVAVAKAFPNNEIISGLAFVCSSRTDAGFIQHIDYGRIAIGHYPTGTSASTDLLGKAFNEAGVPCEVTSNVVRARWIKLLWNAPFNPMSVLMGRANTQVMLSTEAAQCLARQIMEEVRVVAAADGYDFPYELVDKNINDTMVMKPYRPSMLLDFEAKRPLEVEAILGNAVRKASALGVQVPRLQSLYALLQIADVQNRLTLDDTAGQ